MVDLTDSAGGKLDVAPASIVATPGMRGLYGFFLQSTHEDKNSIDITNYANLTLD